MLRILYHLHSNFTTTVNSWIVMPQCFLYVIILYTQSGLPISMINWRDGWSPRDLLLLLLRQVLHTDGAPTIIEFESLEMIKYRVWLPYGVVPLMFRFNPWKSNIMQQLRASRLGIITKWKFKTSVILKSCRMLALFSRYLNHSSTNKEFLNRQWNTVYNSSLNNNNNNNNVYLIKRPY